MKRERDEYDWIVEKFRGRRPPTKRHPDGMERWVDVTAPGPFHRRRLDTAIRVAKRVRRQHQDLLDRNPANARLVLGEPPILRLRNTKTGNIIMADVL